MSPPAIVAVFQPGGHDGASCPPAPSSRQPFSRSLASSRASDVPAPGTGQSVPSAVVSNQWLGSPVMSESGSTPVLTFGRSSPDVLPERDQFGVEMAGEKGRPLLSETIEFSCHRLRNGFDAGAGISHVTFAAKTWRM